MVSQLMPDGGVIQGVAFPLLPEKVVSSCGTWYLVVPGTWYHAPVPWSLLRSIDLLSVLLGQILASTPMHLGLYVR